MFGFGGEPKSQLEPNLAILSLRDVQIYQRGLQSSQVRRRSCEPKSQLEPNLTILTLYVIRDVQIYQLKRWWNEVCSRSTKKNGEELASAPASQTASPMH